MTLSFLNTLLYLSKNILLVSLRLVCLSLGHGSEKFKYILSTSLSNILSIFITSNLINFKLFNSNSLDFCIALTITLSYYSIPIKLILGYFKALLIIKSPLPIPSSI